MVNSWLKLCSVVKSVFVSVQNFESAVQDNVLVNGQPWEEAPDVEGDALRYHQNSYF